MGFFKVEPREVFRIEIMSAKKNLRPFCQHMIYVVPICHLNFRAKNPPKLDPKKIRIFQKIFSVFQQIKIF